MKRKRKINIVLFGQKYLQNQAGKNVRIRSVSIVVGHRSVKTSHGTFHSESFQAQLSGNVCLRI